MKIHEYQAKAILAKHGVPVPQGEVIFKAEDAAGVAERLGGGVVVVKAQIHAGGRGKGGGVKVVKNPAEAQATAAKILGMNLVTHPDGAVRADRSSASSSSRASRSSASSTWASSSTARRERLVLMVSPEGGVEIEKVAEETPEKIFKEFIHPGIGLSAYQTRKLAFALGLQGPQVAAGDEDDDGALQAPSSRPTRRCSRSTRSSSPKSGELLALDAKMSFDDNAIFRHPEFKELRDIAEEDPLEVEASKFSLNYIKLDGTIGCMVNGAGLAMATMDIIKLAGGEPANFLDVGGGANAEQIKNAFRILMADKAVKAVLINIFGGILRCDILAEGVIAAVKDLGVPRADRDPDGGHQRRAGQADAEGERAQLRNRGRHERSGPQGCSGGEAANGCTDRQEHAPAGPGDHRARRHLSRETGGGVRDDGRRRRDPRQGGHDPRGLARLQHRRRVRQGDRRQRVGHLRAPARRRRRRPRGGRRGPAAGGLHHRRHSDARHAARVRRDPRRARPA